MNFFFALSARRRSLSFSKEVVSLSFIASSSSSSASASPSLSLSSSSPRSRGGAAGPSSDCCEVAAVFCGATSGCEEGGRGARAVAWEVARRRDGGGGGADECGHGGRGGGGHGPPRPAAAEHPRGTPGAAPAGARASPRGGAAALCASIVSLNRPRARRTRRTTASTPAT